MSAGDAERWGREVEVGSEVGADFRGAEVSHPKDSGCRDHQGDGKLNLDQIHDQVERRNTVLHMRSKTESLK
jgi:hypothetical protein